MLTLFFANYCNWHRRFDETNINSFFCLLGPLFITDPAYDDASIYHEAKVRIVKFSKNKYLLTRLFANKFVQSFAVPPRIVSADIAIWSVLFERWKITASYFNLLHQIKRYQNLINAGIKKEDMFIKL
jgi:hypothetical protein